MKKAIHLLLLAFYLFSCTELLELAKLPVLFQHYFEHKSLDEKMTFADYLVHHYNDVPHTDNDEARDNQLPFKKHDVCAAGALSAALPPSLGLQLKKAQQVIVIKKVKLHNDYIPHSAFAGKIWQPPKAILS